MTRVADAGAADMPRVLLADDHAMIREGLRLMLESHGIEVIGEAADGAVAIRNARALRPDVVLMDLRMPGTDGIAATREIVAAGTADVIVLTSFDEDELVLAAIRAGAVGFLLKTTDALSLVDAVRRVAAGEGVLDPRVSVPTVKTHVSRCSPSSAPRAALTSWRCSATCAEPPSARAYVYSAMRSTVTDVNRVKAASRVNQAPATVAN